MKIVFLDVDGTLTEVSSPWQDIHEHYGLWQTKGIPILNAWLSGDISYDEFCQRDVTLWNDLGLSMEEILSRFNSYQIRKETVPVLNRLISKGLHVVLLSSGFTHIGKRILADLENPKKVLLIANELHENSEGLSVTVYVSGDENSSRSKAGHVLRICYELGVNARDAAAIGDGPSDQHMFDACGQSFMISGDSELRKAAESILSP